MKSRTLQAVVLVGFMGAGKTSVGRSLANQLGWRFEDLDDRIERREQCSVAEIFAKSGESGFRRAEHDALLEAAAESRPNYVLVLGGGAFVQADNVRLLTHLPIIFLDAPVDELWHRCQADPRERPLRQAFDQFCQLYETRRPYYLRASLRVETSGKDIETIVTEISSALKLR